jgi:hypothetical protein
MSREEAAELGRKAGRQPGWNGSLGVVDRLG